MSSSSIKPFLQALDDGPLLFDGAMGSLLYERGIYLTRSFDELNVSQPELIRQSHRDYLLAGAQILETNTFGANRLALTKHGHGDRTVEINRAGVLLAREVAGDRAYVAGAIGPTGIQFSVACTADRTLALRTLTEQIEILTETGADLIILETFASILEMEAAIEVAKKRTNLPVVAQMVFDSKGYADGCLSPAVVGQRLIDAGADVIGANCGVGPGELFHVGAELVPLSKPVAIQPNAGFPSIVDGRTIYVANPEHFGVFARRMLKSGVRVIGGCCGTTPEHIRAMLGAVRMMSGGKAGALAQSQSYDRPHDQPQELSQDTAARQAESHAGAHGSVISVQRSEERTPLAPMVPMAERSRLGKRLAAGEFVVSVEVNAPQGTDAAGVVEKIQQLLDAGVDVVNIADGPRATARMSNLALCATLRASTGVEPILHVCARDRNYLGLVAHLLGAHTLGMRNLVIITGDPPKMGDYPFATPVYDVDSIGLLRMAATLNSGFDPAGKELEGHTSFLLATGAEPGAHDYERELRRLEQKRDAGAELVMTQPVYDPRTLERFLDDAAPLGVPVMVGLLPLASHRNAEFLHHNVPGMRIPEEYRERMAKVCSGPEARAEGIRIAQEALDAVKHRVAGAYIMPPFNRVESAIAILEVAKDRWIPATAPARPKSDAS